MKSSITGYFEKSAAQCLRWPTARRVLLVALTTAPAFLAAGCSKPAAELCELACECEGCTQSEYEDCLGDGEAATAEADQAGCASQYGDFLSCVLEEAECRNDENFDFDGCTVEQDALTKCGYVVNACDQAAKKLCDCDLGCGSGPSGNQCTGLQACQSTCMLTATCSDIINQPVGSDYANCLANC